MRFVCVGEMLGELGADSEKCLHERPEEVALQGTFIESQTAAALFSGDNMARRKEDDSNHVLSGSLDISWTAQSLSHCHGELKTQASQVGDSAD